MGRQRNEFGEKEPTGSLSRLKAEVKKLRRQNARLRRRLEKHESGAEEDEDAEDFEPATVDIPQGPCCSECESTEIFVLDAATKTIYVCVRCKHRWS